MSRPFIPGGPARYAHQKAGLRKLIETRGICALLFEPGLGKTATTLDYASLLALKSPSGEARVLVVAPLAAIDTWVDQIGKWASPQVGFWAEALGGSIAQRAEAIAARGGRPFAGRGQSVSNVPSSAGYKRSPALAVRTAGGDTPDPLKGPQVAGKPRITLLAVNLDAFANRRAYKPGSSVTNTDRMIEAVKRFQPDLLVVDESHRIKSASSNTSRALARLTDVAPRRVLLTGTVMPHSPLDVYGQWRFLDPMAFGQRGRKASFASFRGRFATMGGFMGREVIGYKNLDEMQQVMARNAIVAKKADALDLPPVTDAVVHVDLSPAEQRAYKAMKDDLAAQLSDGSLATVPNRLAQLMRLRQITSGFLHDTASGVTDVLGEAKARVIKSIVSDTLAGEKRVVVFCHFRHELDQMEQMLAEKGTEVLRIDGSTSTEDRQLMRKRFGSGDPARLILLAQTRTMSLAVNELVTASHAVYGSLSQQRDDLVQSRDRLNRVGQTRPVTFWYALAPGTVDEVIYDAHERRTDLETSMLNHILDR